MTAFPLGQNVTVTLTYESSGAPQFIQNQQAFYVNQFRSFSMTSGGYSTSHTGAFGQINKYDNLSNFDGIQFQVASDQAWYQYTNPRPQAVPFNTVVSNGITQTLGNLFLNLGSNSNAVWNDFTLPTSYNFALFDQTVNMVFGFSDGSFGVGITTMQYVNTSVPAPSAWAVVAGSVIIAGSRRRR